MASPSVIATVVSITGSAQARAADGSLRVLAPGSVLLEGEVVITEPGSSVELATADGESMRVDGNSQIEITHELAAHHAPAPAEASLGGDDVQKILQAIQDDQDLSQVIQDPAAGLDAAGPGGERHTFVLLDRVLEQLEGPAAGSFAASRLELPQFATPEPELPGNPATGTPGGPTPPVDTEAPNAGMVSVLTGNPSPALGGTVDDPTARVFLSLGGGIEYEAVNHGDGTWTLPANTFPPLGDGDHAVSWRAVDPAGNASTGSGSVTVDTLAPVVSVDDQLTSDTAPELTGSVDDPTAHVIVTIGGVDYQATNNGDGSWTLADDVVATLAEGSTPVSVRAIDVVGNEGIGNGTVIVDTIAPAPPTVDSLATLDQTPVLTGTWDEGNASTLLIEVNGTTYFLGDGHLTSDGSGHWTLQIPNGADIPFGSYDVVAVTSDLVGNAATDVTVGELIVGNEGPQVAPDSATTNEDNSVTIAVLANDSDPDGVDPASVKIVGTANPGDSLFVSGEGTWSVSTVTGDITFTPTSDFNGQATAIHYTVADLQGARSLPATVSVVVDPQPDPAMVTGDDTGAVQEDGTQSSSGQLNVIDPDAGEAAFVPQTIADANFGSFSIDATGGWSYTLDNNQPDVQALKTGDSLIRSFSVTTIDGTAHTVTITLAGTDDGAVISGVDTGAVQEDGTQSSSGQLNVVDPDAGQAVFVPQTVTDGNYGTFSIDAAGNWTYALDNAHPDVQSLGAGDTRLRLFTVASADGTTHTISVTLAGTNDAPLISGADTGAVQEDGNLSSSGQLNVVDVDAGQAVFVPQTVTDSTYGTFSIDASGNWTYALDNNSSDVQGLISSDTRLRTFTVATADGTTHTVSVTLTGSDDGALISGVDTGAVQEDGTLSSSGQLNVVDPDAGQAVFVPQTVTDSTYGTFSIDASGNWTYALDNNSSDVQGLISSDTRLRTFTVATADGTTHTVSVTLTGSDDGALISGVDTGTVQEDGTLSSSGHLNVVDPDAGQAVFVPQTVTDSTYGTFSIDASGNWTYALDNNSSDVQGLISSDTRLRTFTVATADGTTHTVSVTLTGSDDGALISGVDTGAVQEDGNLSSSGQLNVVDPDAGQAVFVPQTVTDSTYGTFSIDASGNWTYALDNNSSDVQGLISSDTRLRTFTVATADGTTHTVSVTLTGSDDGALISGVDTGAVQEDGTLSSSGQLNVVDPDAGQAVFVPQTVTDSTYGTFSIDASGNWTYALDNNSSDVQGLISSDTRLRTFTVATADGTTHTVSVTLTGSDDGALISGVDTGAVQEDGNLSSSGQLNVVDPDAGQAVFVPQTVTDSTYGTFSIDNSGNWTYALDNNSSDVQGLISSDTRLRTFTVATADGTTHTVSVTLTGSDDGALISGVDTGAVQEDGNLSASGQLNVVDPDAGQAVFVPQTVTDSTYGTFSIDASGNWTYALDNNSSDVQGLISSDTRLRTFTVATADGTTHTVSVTLTGSDDGALISGVDTGAVQEDGTLSSSGQLNVVDPDAGQAVFVPQTVTDSTYGTFSIDASGNWTYALDNNSSDVQGLISSDTRLRTFTVATADGTTHTVSVTLTGSDDGALISGVDTGAVQEDGNLSASGQLNVVDPDAGQAVFVPQTVTDSTYGTFSIDASGNWTYALDNNSSDVQGLISSDTRLRTFTVATADGTTHTVSVTLTGSDDGALISGVDTGAVQEDGNLSSSGQLNVVDPDAGQAVFVPQTVTDSTYGTFSIDASGNWTYALDNNSSDVQGLISSDTRLRTFTVATADGTTHTVSVTLTGSDDGALISGVDTGAVQEDGTLSSSGQLNVVDPDAGQAVFVPQTVTDSTYGTFSIDASGNWTYALDNNSSDVQGLISSDTRLRTFTVATADGTTHTVSVTLTGSDDGALISGVDTGAVQEDGTLSSSGQLNVVDPDAGQAVFVPQTVTDSTYGTFSIDASGNWTYALDNNSSDVQGLISSDTRLRTFTVATADGTTHTVSVTLTGSDDGALISGVDTGAVQEDGTLSSSGHLNVVDPDAGQAVFVPQTVIDSTYGTFSIDASGNWTYALDNNSADVQGLISSDTRLRTFTVATADGTTHTVSVTLTGSDDGALISGVDTGAVQEDGTLSSSGQLNVVDPDAGQAVFVPQTVTDSTYGTFSIDASGNWTYALDNNSSDVQGLISSDTRLRTFTVATADGTTHTVSVTLTGSDDGALISGVDTGAVQEDGNLSASGQLNVVDPDAGQAVFVPQTVTDSTYGTFSIDASGNWTYALDNNSSDVQGLISSDTRLRTFTVATADGTTHTVSVTLTGSDDGALISGVDTGAVQEDGTLSSSGHLNVVDPDAGQAVFVPQTVTDSTYGTFSIDASGNWTYALDNNSADVQGLISSDTRLRTFTVATADGTTHTVSVTLTGSDDGALISGVDTGAVQEDGTLSSSGQLNVVDPDAGQAVFVPQTVTDSTYGTFSIDASGNWTYALDNNSSDVQGLISSDTRLRTFTVATADGTTHTVSVTLTGSDDGALISGVDTGAVQEDGNLSASGQLNVVDPDAGQAVFVPQTVTDSTYGTFSIDASGNWTYALDNNSSDVQGLISSDTRLRTFTVATADGTTHTVSVTLTGSDDGALISGVDTGAVQEDGTLSSSGHLNVVDPDAGQAVFVPQTVIDSTYGTFSIDASGNWTYALDNNSADVQGLISSDTRLRTFTVATADGTTHTVSVTLTGSDDGALISGVDTGAVQEDGTLSSSGQLNVVDPDAGQAVFVPQTVTDSTYGTFSIDASGNWTYALDNNSSDVQGLISSDTRLRTFTVATADGTTHTVSVTLTGSDDGALISGVDTGAVQEDGNLSASGQLNVVDPDAGQAVFVPQTVTDSTYGTFSIDASGNWTYALDNNSSDVQGLISSDTRLRTFTVATADGTTHTVSVTLTGSDDGALISGVDTGAVQEDGTLSSSGHLNVVDPDAGQAVFVPQTVIDSTYGTFSIDASGNWTYALDNNSADVQGLISSDTRLRTFTVATADGTTHTVSVTLTGSDDGALISGVDTGAVQEDGTLSSSGQLNVVDPDAGQAVFVPQTVTDSTYGTFSIDASGNWTYALDNNSSDVQGLISSDTRLRTFTVATADGTTHTVSVTLTGSDDGALISGVDTGAVQEDGNLSSSGQLNVVDPDAGQAVFVPQTVTDSTYGTFSIDASGNWTYALDNNSSDVQGLISSDTRLRTFTVATADGTTHTVSVTLTGSDDGALISGVDTGAVQEDGNLSSSGQLNVVDPDAGQAVFVPQTVTDSTYGTFSIDASGNWTYALDNNSSDVQGLISSDTRLRTFTVATADGTTHTVSVTLTGSDDGALISGVDTGAVQEDGNLSASGQLNVVDPDAGQAVFVPQTVTDSTYGTFSIDNSGNWTYALDNNSSDVQGLISSDTRLRTFTVATADGTTHTVSVTLTGSDDGALISGVDTGAVQEDGNLSSSGQLNVVDPDAGQAVFVPQTVTDSTYGTFSIDASGNWTYALDNNSSDVQGLISSDTRLRTFTVATADGTTHTVSVTLTGSDDGALISGVDTGAVQEDGNLSSSGQLNVVDPDAGQAVFVPQTVTDSTYGTFSIDASGNWTYALDNNSSDVQGLISSDTRLRTFTVATADGTTHTVSVTLTGSDDGALISGVDTGAVQEDGNLSASGQLNVVDPDAGQAVFVPQTVTDSTYGTFSIDNSGNWTYALDNNSSDVQGLISSDTRLRTFTVATADGTTHTVSVTLTGSDDGALISGVDTGAVQEDGTLSSSGQLNVVDPDAGQAVFVPQTVTDSTYGTFSIDASGNWTYALDNNSSDVQGLISSDTRLRTFTVATADGTTHTVSVTLTGSDDGALISGVDTSAVQEDGTLSSSGQLNVVDPDAGQAVFVPQTVTDSTYGTFSIDASGNWTYALDNNSSDVQGLISSDTRLRTFTVATADGTTHTVSVTLTGSDDGALISGVDTGTVQEDGTLSSSGHLNVVDPDAGQAVFVPQTVTDSTYGTFSIDNSGNWTYALDNNSADVQGLISSDTRLRTFTVATADGTTHTVSVTLTGSDDGALISGVDTGTVQEDGTLSSSGHLNVVDPDAGQAVFVPQTVTDSTYGTFSIDNSGNWTYALDNNSADVQGLISSDTRLRTFTVATADGTTHTVSVTLTGSDDGALISGVDTGAVQEDGTLSSSGQLNVVDPDAGQAVFVPQTVTDSTYGTFSIDASGNWTYALDNNSSDVQGLISSDTRLRTFTVATADGTTHTVSITLTGSDDGALISGVDTGAVQEDGNLSSSGQLNVVDPDAGQAVFVPQTVTDSTYGTFSIDASGNWTYALDNNSSDVQGLISSDTRLRTFTVATADGTTHTVSVTLTGSDDGALISGVDTGAVQEDGTLSSSGQLNVVDPDAGQAVFVPQTVTDSTYGTFSIDASGNWTYALDNNSSDVQGLISSDTRLRTFTVATADGTTHTVSVTLTGSDDGALISGVDTSAVQEDGTLSSSGQLNVVDPDAGQAVFVPQTVTDSTYGTFSIDASGNWTYALDNNSSDVQGLISSDTRLRTFTVATADGTTHTVSVTLTGSDDGALISGVDTGAVQEDGNLSSSGQLNVVDPDAGQAVFVPQTVTDSTYGTFSIDASGNWTYALDNNSSDVQGLISSDTRLRTFTVATADGTTHTVSVTLTGSDDGALISGVDTGAVQEDGNLSASGQLNVVDPDAGQAVFVPQTVTDSTYGTFSIDASGNWTYALDNNSSDVQGLISSDTRLRTFTVATADGTTHTVSVTLTGSDDGALISGVDTGAVQEDGNLSASGQLNVVDPDAGQAVFVPQTVTDSTYGTFSIDNSGNWTYALDNNSSDVQGLISSDTRLRTFTVATADGTTHTVSVTLTGSDDGALISGVDTGAVQEDGNLSASGQLNVMDPDAGQAVFVPQTVTDSTYGTFSIDNSGNWTYALDNNSSDVQGLASGETRLRVFAVETADGTSHTVTVTLTGSNDGTVIGGVDTGAVQEDGILNASGKLDIYDADAGQSMFVPQTLADGNYGTFSIDASGNWTYALDNSHADVQALAAGDTRLRTFTVETADGTSHTVSVTITGTNDLALISGADTGTVREDVTLNASGALNVADVDAGEAVFVPQNVADGSYGTFSIDASGSWTYALNNSDAAVQSLGAGDVVTRMFTVATADGTTHVISITINGSNDGAIIGGVDTGAVREDITLSASGALTVTDVDAGQASFVAQTVTDGAYGAFSVDSAGAWTYSLNNGSATVQALGAGDSVTRTFNVATADGTTQAVTVTINGTNDAAVIGGTATGTVKEDTTLSTSGTLTVTDVDAGQASFVAQSVTDGGYGTFSIDSAGAWSYSLNNASATVQALGAGDSVTRTFNVATADGTTQAVTVTINGTNDAAVIGGTATGTVKEDTTLSTSGTLTVTDVDAGQASFVAQSVTDGGYGTFSIDSAGAWSYSLNNASATVQALGAGDSVTRTFNVATADGTTQAVTVTINGTNDAAVIGGTATGTVKEDTTLSTSGTLTVTDVDAGQASFVAQSVTDGGYGTFSIDSAGAWSYSLNNGSATVQALGAGDSVTRTFNVATADGTTQAVTVTINGTNDAAVIGGTATGTVKEDTTLSTSGTLTVTDVDAGQASFVAQSVTDGGYGTFSIDSAGAWSYSLNNASATVQALGAGDSVTRTFNVATADGTTQAVTVTINGTNDAAVIGGTATGTVKEDTTLSTSGSLTITDVDTGQATFVPQNVTDGGYGTFTVNAAGAWAYTLNNASATIQSLGASDSVTRNFTVASADGTTRVVAITINGTNDAAVIGGTATGTVKEDTTLSAGGTLTVTDVDAGQATFVAQSVTDGSYGTFSVNSAGVWSYALNNASTAVQNLLSTSSLVRAFTVTTADGTAQTVSVTITGTDDANPPVVTANPVTGDEDTSIALNLAVALNGGQQTLTSVTLSGIPSGASLTNTAGDTLTVSGGSITLSGPQLTGLALKPPTNSDADFTLNVSARSTGGDGSTATTNTSMGVTVTAVADAPSLAVTPGTSTIPSTYLPPASTGLKLDTFTATPAVSTANATNANNLETLLTGQTPTTTQSVMSLSGSITLPVDTAVRVTGLMLLEAGKSYVFSGFRDDTFHIEVGTNVLFTQGYNNSGNYTAAAFAPTTTGYYTFETYAYNGAGSGSFNMVVSVNGGAAQALSTLSTYATVADLDAAGTVHGAFVGTSDGGYYAAGSLANYVAVGNIAAGLTDTDGSESLSLFINDIPVGAVITDGTHVFTATSGNTSVNVTGWSLSTLWMNPPSYSQGDVRLEVEARSTEASNGSTAVTTATLAIDVRTLSVAGVDCDEPAAATVRGEILKSATGPTSVDQWTFTHAGGAFSMNAQTASGFSGEMYVFRVNADGTLNTTAVASDDGSTLAINIANLSAGRYMVAFGSGSTGGGASNLTSSEASNLTSLYPNNGGTDGTYSITFGPSVTVLASDQPYLKDMSGQAQIIQDGYATMTFDVTLDEAPTAASGPVTVHYATVNGTATAGASGTGDYGAASGDLTFNVGETHKYVTVQVYADSIAEAKEQFSLQLTSLSGNARYSSLDTQIAGGISADGSIHPSGALTIGDPTITGTDARDVLSGDLGGVLIDGSAGARVVYVIDTSGSMAYDAATGSTTNVTVSRMDVLKAAMAQLTSAYHDAALTGVPVTLTFITYGGATATTSTTFNIGNATQYQNALNYLNGLVPNGGTPQDEAVDALKTLLQGMGTDVDHGKVYFLTDGTPTDTAAALISNASLSKYLDTLAATPEIQGIAIGNNIVTADVDRYLSPIDNTINPDGTSGAAHVVDATQLPHAIVGFAPAQDNTITGGAGDDVIFGDAINTDALTGVAGQGYQGLLNYLRGSLGHEPSQQEARDYILDHHTSLNVGGDPLGGNDTLDGGTGNDVIYGQGGHDTIHGGDGNDHIVGGAGNDTMDGGLGADVFAWELHDGGTPGTPAVDTITDFDTRAPTAGGDVLDLRDLLVDEAGQDLSKYLHFEHQGTDTVVQISTTGGFATGYDSSHVEQTIVLKNVDLLAGFPDQHDLIQNLLANGKLITD